MAPPVLDLNQEFWEYFIRLEADSKNALDKNLPCVHKWHRLLISGK